MGYDDWKTQNAYEGERDPRDPNEDDLAMLWDARAIAVLDFETTSADPETCGPVSVACVRLEGGEETDSFYSLLNPGCEISEEASAIHGITADQVVGAPVLTDVAHELLRVAKHALPCAYNASFDRRILHRHIQGTDAPMFDPAHLWLCPLVVVRDVDRWERGKGRHKLVNACKRWGVTLDGAHNALADARATGRLLFKLFERGVLKSCRASKLLEHIERRRAVQDAEFADWLARQPKREEPSGRAPAEENRS